MGGRPQLRLLGSFRLLDEHGAEVVLSSRKGRALLAYLAARPSWECDREHLAALLWDDLPDERARHNLRQAVAKLRKELPEGIVVAGDRTLGLDGKHLEIDLWRFERLCASPDLAAQSEAVDIVTGPFVDGLTVKADPFDLWVTDERARIDRRVDRALARLAENARQHARSQECIELCNRRIDRDPACEDAYRMLIEVHRDAGRRAQALRCYEACAEALRRHLGVDPLPATRVLAEGLGDERPRARREEAPPKRGGPETVEALDAHERAAHCYVSHTPEHSREAERLLLRALDDSPGFARAHAKLAFVLTTDYINGWSGRDGLLARAQAAADEAVACDAAEPEAHVARALVAMWSRRLEDALEHTQRAIDLAPGLAGAYSLRGNALHFSGRNEDALIELQAAMRLDGQHLGTYLLFLGRCQFARAAYAEAIEALRARLLGTPWSDVALVHLAACYGHTGRHDEARDAWRRALEVNPRYSLRQKRSILPYADPEPLDRLAAGLRAAGIDPSR